MRNQKPAAKVFVYDGETSFVWTGAKLLDTKMDHGGPRQTPPTLLVPLRNASESSKLDNVSVELANPNIITGRSNGFQIWRWCTVDELRQFIPLADIDLSSKREFKCASKLTNTANQNVVICRIGDISVTWRAFDRLMPLILVEHQEFILFTMHPEIPQEKFTKNATRYLWVDIPLKPVKEKPAKSKGCIAETCEDGTVSLLSNKDIALLICRLVSPRELGRLAQCSKLLNKVVDVARGEFIRSCVFDPKMIDSSKSNQHILKEHFTTNFCRVSAIYEGRFVNKIVMELQLGEEYAVSWCVLPEKNQMRVERPMFMD